jgi:hypothetical protein
MIREFRREFGWRSRTMATGGRWSGAPVRIDARTSP